MLATARPSCYSIGTSCTSAFRPRVLTFKHAVSPIKEFTYLLIVDYERADAGTLSSRVSFAVRRNVETVGGQNFRKRGLNRGEGRVLRLGGEGGFTAAGG